jgi:hypothetical protein
MDLNEKPKTFGLKLSELRPCDGCNGPLVPAFQYIEIRHAVFNQRSVNATLGTAQILGGLSHPGAVRIAEALSPGADDAVEVITEPEATTILFVCLKCMMEPIDLAVLVAKRGEKEIKHAKAPESTQERQGG